MLQVVALLFLIFSIASATSSSIEIFASSDDKTISGLGLTVVPDASGFTAQVFLSSVLSNVSTLSFNDNTNSLTYKDDDGLTYYLGVTGGQLAGFVSTDTQDNNTRVSLNSTDNNVWIVSREINSSTIVVTNQFSTVQPLIQSELNDGNSTFYSIDLEPSASNESSKIFFNLVYRAVAPSSTTSLITDSTSSSSATKSPAKSGASKTASWSYWPLAGIGMITTLLALI